MNEGDVVVVFSQYGEVADICLMRDKKTKKSRGFAYLAYVDQRSTDVAVDNLNGSLVCGRYIKVDHVRDFKLPKEAYILEPGETPESKAYKPTGPDGKGWGNFRTLTEEEERQIRELADEVEHSKAVAMAKQARYNENAVLSQVDQDKMFDENQETMEMKYQNKELIQIKIQYQKLLEEKQRKKAEKKAKKEQKRAKKEKKHKERSRDKVLDPDSAVEIADQEKLLEQKQKKGQKRQRESSSRSVSAESKQAKKKDKKKKEKSKGKKHKKEKDKKGRKERSRSKDKKRKESSSSSEG